MGCDMQHLFASGEHIHKKNIKKLEQGDFRAEYLEYDDIGESTIYKALGDIDGKPASVKFKISGEAFQEIKFKHMIRILMQSDLMISDWETYEICYE